MNNSIVNLLIQLKNASLVFKETIVVSYSALVLKMVKVLYKQGLIQHYRVFNISTNKKGIKISIRYRFGKPVFGNLKILSKPSNLKYLRLKDLYKIREKKRIFFLSTSLGFLTSVECKKLRSGGKSLFVS